MGADLLVQRDQGRSNQRFGGASYEPARVADPCQPREWRSPSGVDEIAQQITLSALDGAACRLHVSRETLVLALGTSSGRQRFIDNPRLSAALRAGLVRAIDDAERAGAIPGPVATGLRAIAEQLPTDEVVSAVRDASTLLNDATPPWVRAELRRMGYTETFEDRTSGPINAIFVDRVHGSFWGGSSNHGEDYGIGW